MSSNYFTRCIFPSRITTNWDYVRIYWVFHIIMIFIFGIFMLFAVQFLPIMGILFVCYIFRGRIKEKLPYIFFYSCIFIAIQVVLLIFLSIPYWMFILENIKRAIIITAISAFVIGNIFHFSYFYPKYINYLRHLFYDEELIPDDDDEYSQMLITEEGINNNNISNNHNHNQIYDDSDDENDDYSFNHHSHHHHHHHHRHSNRNNNNNRVHHTVLNNIRVYTSIPIDDEEFEEARRLQLIHDREQQRRKNEEEIQIQEQIQYGIEHNILQPTVCVIPPELSGGNNNNGITRESRVSSSHNVYVNNTSYILHCAICGMTPLKFAVMNCGHMCFCENCKLGYELQGEKYCPMCSQPIEGFLRVYDSEDANCVICLTEPITHAIVPCGHFCLCDSCQTICEVEDENRCPVCRGEIDNYLKIYT